MRLIAVLISIALPVLSACVGPYFYKYERPQNIEQHSKTEVRFNMTGAVPQAGYFLNGETCSDLRNLEISKERLSATVFTPVGKMATFHILGLVSGRITANATSDAPYEQALELTTCGNKILSFQTQAGHDYTLNFQQLEKSCAISLIQRYDGRSTNVSHLLKERSAQFGFDGAPSSSFCTDRLERQP